MYAQSKLFNESQPISSDTSLLDRSTLEEIHRITLSKEEREELANYLQFLRNYEEKQKAITLDGEHKTSAEDLFIPLMESRNSMVPKHLRRMFTRICVQKIIQTALTDEDIQEFVNRLENSEDVIEEDLGQGNFAKTISYNGLIKSLKGLERVQQAIKPSKFFVAHSSIWLTEVDNTPRLPIDKIIEFVNIDSALARHNCGLIWYDQDCSGLLSRDQFIKYYREQVMPNIESLRNLEEPFLICYIHTSSTMFFFFLDPYRTGKISIFATMASGLLENAYELANEPENYENWFSADKTHELIATFKMFSGDKGFLTRHDFETMFDGVGYTKSYFDRVFDTCLGNPGKGMTYEEYVVYEIATAHIAHPVSLAFFFRILDIDNDGIITRFELRYFYRELCPAYNQYVGDEFMPKFDDFCDQFFDMVGPSHNGRITVEDLIKCSQGREFIRCITNYQFFYDYEMRESEAAAALEDDTIALNPSDGVEESSSPLDNEKENIECGDASIGKTEI